MTTKGDIFRPIIFYSVIFLLFGQPVARSQDAARVIFTYRGRPYTCKDLTGVSYVESMKYVQEAQKLFDKTKKAPPDHSFFSTTVPFNIHRTTPRTMLLYFKHCINNGIIPSWIYREAFNELCKQYPSPHNKFYRFDQFDSFCHVYSAAISSRHNGRMLLLNGLVADNNADEFATTLSKLGLRDPKTIHRYYKEFYEARAFVFLSARCFPRVINNSLSPWLRMNFCAGLLPYHIKSIVSENQERWKHGYTVDYSRYTYVHILHLGSNGKHSVSEMLKQSIGFDESIAVRGLNRFRRTLSYSHAKLKIEVVLGKLGKDVKKCYGLSLDNVPYRKLISIEPNKEYDGEYLFFVSSECPHVNITSENIPSGLYDIARKSLLFPVLEQILSELKVKKPFVSPSESVLFEKYQSFSLYFSQKTLAGFKLPNLILTK